MCKNGECTWHLISFSSLSRTKVARSNSCILNLFFIRLTQGWEKARRKLDQKNADYEGAIEELNGLREDYKNVKKEYYDQDRRYDGIS